MKYDREYYSSGNYKYYQDRVDRYAKMIKEIDHLLDQVSLREPDFATLDFGCATGHVVKALRQIGYTRAIGYDISEFAVNEGNNQMKNAWLTDNRAVLQRDNWLTFALDVFEHMTVDEIQSLFQDLKTHFLLVRVPLADENGEFILQTARDDESHVTGMTKQQWYDLFSDSGFDELFELNLNTIWTSEGVLAAVLEKNDS